MLIGNSTSQRFGSTGAQSSAASRATTSAKQQQSASQLFGSSSAQDIFSASVSAGPTQEQQSARAIVKAQTREINRIRGYKLDLTPAENHRLTEIQGEILKIQEKVNQGTVRSDELDDRVNLYKEADTIIGKPVLDTETTTDDTFVKFTSSLETLLLPKLNPAQQARVDSLQRVKDGIEARLTGNPDNSVVRAQFQSVTNTLNALQPLRSVQSLSNEERGLYDNIVTSLNDYVGVKLQLSSKDAIRVRTLEESIANLQSNLAADPAGQPTSGAVNRALTRFA